MYKAVSKYLQDIIKKPARHQNNDQHQHLIKQSAYTFRFHSITQSDFRLKAKVSRHGLLAYSMTDTRPTLHRTLMS